jgi:hypothetical protein
MAEEPGRGSSAAFPWMAGRSVTGRSAPLTSGANNDDGGASADGGGGSSCQGSSLDNSVGEDDSGSAPGAPRRPVRE